MENFVSVVHLSVQSLKPKIDFLGAEFSGIDIITLNETWLDNRTPSSDILIPGFKEPFRRDRLDGYVWRGISVKNKKFCLALNIYV